MFFNLIKLFLFLPIFAFSIDRSFDLGISDKDSKDHIKEKPKRIVLKEGKCLKFKKNNEKFWENWETDFFIIISVGKYNYKVKKINFPQGINDLWYFDGESEKNIISFENQNKFYLEECPSRDNMISEKELDKILNSNK